MDIKDKLGDKLRYDIPDGSKKTRCRACDAVIYFVPTRRGKSMPVDEDGTPHWATCTDANEFRR